MRVAWILGSVAVLVAAPVVWVIARSGPVADPRDALVALREKAFAEVADAGVEARPVAERWIATFEARAATAPDSASASEALDAALELDERVLNGERRFRNFISLLHVAPRAELVVRALAATPTTGMDRLVFPRGAGLGVSSTRDQRVDALLEAFDSVARRFRGTEACSFALRAAAEVTADAGRRDDALVLLRRLTREFPKEQGSWSRVREWELTNLWPESACPRVQWTADDGSVVTVPDPARPTVICAWSSSCGACGEEVEAVRAWARANAGAATVVEYLADQPRDGTGHSPLQHSIAVTGVRQPVADRWQFCSYPTFVLLSAGDGRVEAFVGGFAGIASRLPRGRAAGVRDK